MKFFNKNQNGEVTEMSLIKYSRPNTDIFNRNFNDFVDEFFNTGSNYGNGSFTPSVDVAETETQFEIEAQLPGLKKEEIKIELENGRLTISGERILKNEEKEKNYHRLETHYGSFSRSFYLPDSIDEESVEAKYNDGILSITINKKEEKVKKSIQIG